MVWLYEGTDFFEGPADVRDEQHVRLLNTTITENAIAVDEKIILKERLPIDDILEMLSSEIAIHWILIHTILNVCMLAQVVVRKILLLFAMV